MKRKHLFATVLATLGMIGLLQAQATAEIDPERWGFSPTSVFYDPAPEVFSFSSVAPGEAGVLRRGFEGAPPQIPHRIDHLLPITLKDNMCMDCHDRPERIGQAPSKGTPTPMSRSHYVEQGGKLSFHFRRHTCVDCHVPQAAVEMPVANVFGKQ